MQVKVDKIMAALAVMNIESIIKSKENALIHFYPEGFLLSECCGIVYIGKIDPFDGESFGVPVTCAKYAINCAKKKKEKTIEVSPNKMGESFVEQYPWYKSPETLSNLIDKVSGIYVDIDDYVYGKAIKAIALSSKGSVCIHYNGGGNYSIMTSAKAAKEGFNVYDIVLIYHELKPSGKITKKYDLFPSQKNWDKEKKSNFLG